MANKEFTILVLNMGSLSMRCAVYKNDKRLFDQQVGFDTLMEKPDDFMELKPVLKDMLLKILSQHNISLESLDIIVSRGGLGKPSCGGAHEIDKEMCDILATGKYGRHPSAMGPIIAHELSALTGKKSIIIDPPSTDEFEPLARISGTKGIQRKSAFHALNQKAVAIKGAELLQKPYEELNFIVAHLGGGITIGAHAGGRVIDSTHGLSEGPFSPERAGSLPTLELLDIAASEKKIKSVLVGKGGLFSYLGTTDAREVEKRIAAGDDKAALILEAMAYQISKDIGAMATVLKGDIDAIILTGSLTKSKMLINWVTERISFLGKMFLFPGEDEMVALAQGAMRILNGREEIRLKN